MTTLKSVKLHQETYDALLSLQRPRETIDALVRRLLTGAPLMESPGPRLAPIRPPQEVPDAP